eukprot:125927-Karenia_brevis.AAC.1
MPEGVKDDEREEQKDDQSKGESKDRAISIETKERVPRSFKINEDDIAKHTGTNGCPGCSA